MSGLKYTPEELTSSGVYFILCLATGKAYIGSTSEFRRRWREHRTELLRNKHSNAKLQNAWNKYGSEQFCWGVLEFTDDLLAAEQAWLDEFQTYKVGFNLCPVAGSPQANMPWTPQRKSKMQDHLNKLNAAPRTQAQLDHAVSNFKNLKQSAAQKAKTSQHMKDYNRLHPYKHVWTEEQRENLKQAQLKRRARERGEL